MPVTLTQIERAAATMSGVVHHTPLAYSRTLSEMTGCAVHLKLENLQKTGAFKIRGAFYKVASLPDDVRARGLITASAGNHAQGVAFAAAWHRVPSLVVMPEAAPVSKYRATAGYGAAVRLCGANYNEAAAKALQLAAETGMTLVPAFDDADIIAGQGTVGLEVGTALPEVDAVLVPIGGGGLAAGVAVALTSLLPRVRVIGVQPAGADAAYRSWRQGARQTVDHPHSVADGLLVQAPGLIPWGILRDRLHDVVVVTEDQIRAAMCLLLERTKLLAEGAGAVALAALHSGQVHLPGKRVAVIVSGGNVDLAQLAQISAAAVPPKVPVGQ